MARPKGAKNKTKNKIKKQQLKPNKPMPQPLDPRVEEVYEKVIEFDCPVRGRVKQKVLVKKYVSLWQDVKQYIKSEDSLEKIDGSESELPVYGSDDSDGASE